MQLRSAQKLVCPKWTDMPHGKNALDTFGKSYIKSCKMVSIITAYVYITAKNSRQQQYSATNKTSEMVNSKRELTIIINA